MEEGQIAIVAVGCFALGIIVGKALGFGDDTTGRIVEALESLELRSVSFPPVQVFRVDPTRTDRTSEVIEG